MPESSPAEAVLTDGAPLQVRLADTDIRILETLLAPLRAWTSPRFYGLNNIPAEGPVLLVGNHNLLGAIDAPLLLPEVLRHRGRLIRGLAEHVLIAVPGVRHFLHRYGSVRGTRGNCLALLERGEAVIVFPGGGREAVRRKGEKYVLKWEGRTGFAHMALTAGVPIVPVAMIGVDDAFDIVVDGDHPLMRPVRWTVEALGLKRDLTPPLVRGIGLTPIPRPERFYFSAGAPIDPAPWVESDNPESAAADLRDVVRKALEEEIRFLLAERDRDSGRTLVGRMKDLLRR
ncbi:lysophospholipid acyltransferase family protein [Nocardia farcinica]|uniref:lysophospholipid acyltransferase family protein n=1 Tax=Nocardia farcinica TaxID=37329 RepID=UPI001894E07F|nr:lysophospholipid acyltransferase family protein [Nocardia farcinica]MBF6382932.1 acyltransferase family protein [Nocardia farcinica]MBF6538277.1 acyltransferase family protein [Nocardia farcinica]